MDNGITRELFKGVTEASEILGRDEELRDASTASSRSSDPKLSEAGDRYRNGLTTGITRTKSTVISRICTGSSPDMR